MASKKNTGKPNHHTVLFKKILSSFFSKEAMMQIGMNPASMFVSFVSSKQFFGLINRRMAEHYKLNLFDINLDPFDVKIGFGEDETMTVKNIDIYYAYNSSANFLGYKNYSPNMIATSLSMFFAAQSVELFESEHDILFANFIYAIYFVAFLVISKIKVFPEGSKQEQFDRFNQLFWNFYQIIFLNTGRKLFKKDLRRIQNLVGDKISLMFALYHSIYQLHDYLYVANDENKEALIRLLSGELKHKTHMIVVKEYLELYDNLSTLATVSDLEKKIIDLVVPADIMLRYLLSDNESKLISQHILTTIYPPKTYNALIESFIENGDQATQLIQESLNFPRIKKHFFFGLQRYIKAKIKSFTGSADDLGNLIGEDLEESIDEFLSYLSDNDQIDIDALPKNIQVQSITFDKLINFYISFVGGFWIARGDNAYLRLFKPQLLRKLLTLYAFSNSSEASLRHYVTYLRLYEKNSFYYQYVFNHVRSGKDSFILPTNASFISHESDFFIIQLLNESYRSILLQDISSSTIQLFIKNSDILDSFKALFEHDISQALKLSTHELIARFYGYYNTIGSDTTISHTIHDALNHKDFTQLKDSMYSLGFRLYDRLINQMLTHKIHHQLEAPILLSLFSKLKETLFGFLLYRSYIKHNEEAHQKNYHSALLLQFYNQYLLDQQFQDTHTLLSTLIQEMQDTYQEILQLWILLDDNQDYMYIGFNNWTNWVEHASQAPHDLTLTREDMLRFGGYLKNINYYNKRFLIPDH